MSAETLRTAIVGAIAGITPTWEAALAWTLHDGRTGEILQYVSQGARRFEVVEGPPEDDGTVQGGAIDTVRERWLVRWIYPTPTPHDPQHLASRVRADVVDVVNAIRPPSVWATHVLDVQVEQVADAIDVQGEGGAPLARVVELPLWVRYDT